MNLTAQPNPLAQQGTDIIGEILRSLVTRLSVHYGVSKRELEILMLIEIAQDMLALTPQDETSSTPNVFRDRLACRHEKIRKTLEEVLSVTVDVEGKTRKMRAYHDRIARFLLNFSKGQP